MRTTALLLICLSLCARPVLGGWTITQLTDNDRDDYSPQISGSNVVWRAGDGQDDEIFLYRGGTTTQLTDNYAFYGFHDWNPRISGSNVVWEGVDGGNLSNTDIFFYDGATIHQLTTSSYNDVGPQISGTNAAWLSFDGAGRAHVCFYNGSTIADLTDSAFWCGHLPSLSGSSVVWTENDGNDHEVFVFDGDAISQLTHNNDDDFYPRVSEGNVVWQCRDATGDWEIFLHDGARITQLTHNDHPDILPQVSGSNVAWLMHDGNDHEVFFYDGNTVTQLTYNGNDDGNDMWPPQISGRNVVWSGSDGYGGEIFFWDGMSVSQLTNNDYPDVCPAISGSNVVWMRWDGDWEVMMATFAADVPEPSAWILLACGAAGTFGMMRRFRRRLRIP
jgi:plastocyanin